MIKTYYRLTKPGIIYGNALNTVAGFFLAARGDIDWLLLVTTLLGLSLVIASSCVINNYIDRDIDAAMERTKNRALVSGAVSPRSALIFALILGILGTTILAIFTNITALLVALAGVFVYVLLYTFAKRFTAFSTQIGSIAGAVPPLVGYTAVTANIDSIGLLLFVMLALWQMPHFFAIALYRIEEYRAAHVPVYPIRFGVLRTKIEIVVYIAAFSIATAALAVVAHLGIVYEIVMGLASAAWLLYGLTGFWARRQNRWAREMFYLSLVVVLLLCVTLILQR